MSTDFNDILKMKAINGWNLFWFISVPMSFAIFIEMMNADMSKGEGVSDMIGYSVRWAIPFIYMVVAASSIHILFPSPVSKWWMRNRKHIGLCFAVAMAWQGLYIFIVSTYFRGYYFEEIYYFRDELEGTVGYLFLVAMVVTSFQIGRKYVNPMQWKLIHKGGVYFLWAYAFSVYWWNIFYYPTLEPYSEPRVLDYVFYWTGFLAFALRITAWGKVRHVALMKNDSESRTPMASKILGGAIIAFALFASATGHQWYESVSAFITGTTRSEELVLWLPFWPLEPFLPLLMIGLGTYLMTMAKLQLATDVEPARLSK